MRRAVIKRREEMKYIRNTLMIILLFAVLTVCSTVVLWVMGKIMNITFDNIFYNGFQVGFLAGDVILIYNFAKKKKQ